MEAIRRTSTWRGRWAPRPVGEVPRGRGAGGQSWGECCDDPGGQVVDLGGGHRPALDEPPQVDGADQHVDQCGRVDVRGKVAALDRSLRDGLCLAQPVCPELRADVGQLAGTGTVGDHGGLQRVYLRAGKVAIDGLAEETQVAAQVAGVWDRHLISGLVEQGREHEGALVGPAPVDGGPGACEVCYPQVRNGAITVIPEYNGDLLGVSADASSTAATTAQADQALRT